MLALAQPTPTTFASLQKAVVVTAFDEPLAIHEVPVPALPLEHHVVVKNLAVGVNPVDWKLKLYKFAIYSFPWINGRELSGVVVAAGLKLVIPVHELVVVLSTSYRDLTTLTFQEYTVVDSRLLWKLPHSLSVLLGASIGVGLTTAGVIMYNTFAIGYDENLAGKTLVIYGGATVVGLYLVQLAKFHRATVVAVALTENEAYLTSLGVDQVIDRHLGAVEAALAALNVDYAVDCVSKQTLATLIDHTNAPQVCGIVGGIDNDRVKPVVIKQFHENFEFALEFIQHTQRLLDDGTVKPVRTKVFSGGLATVPTALAQLAGEGARGEKFVVTMR